MWKSHVPQIALVVRVWTWRATKTDNCGYAENVARNVSESVRACGHGKRKVGKAQGGQCFCPKHKNHAKPGR